MLITKSFEFQIKELEAGIARCQGNVKLFQSQVETQITEKPILELELKNLKQGLSQLSKDELEKRKIRILALEDNIARCGKNIEIYSQEVEKQKALKGELVLQLNNLKKEAQN